MSSEERQEDELEFLCAVFPGDCQDLRKNDKWKVYRPPEFVLTLVPQKSMGGSALNKRPLSVKLYTKYTTDYPDSAPQFTLEDPHGLTPDQVKELKLHIEKLASERVGEVMMLDIAQAVQEFLHRHEGPQVSLYEEMVKRQKEKERAEQLRIEAERKATRIKEEEEHRLIAEEIKRKKAELQLSKEDSEESSEDSVHSHSPTPVSDSHSKISTPQKTTSPPVRTPVKGRERGVNRAGGGRTSEIEHIHKGRLLGESLSGGQSVYVGMSGVTGDLLAVYQWALQCRTVKRVDPKRLKQVASIQMEFDSLQSRGIHHPNLVQYLAMSHTYNESTNQITVEVVMEYVGGGSVSSLLRNPDCGPIRGETHRHYSKQLLEALSYLHSQGVVHNDIRPSLVFFETGGSIKLGGHSIIKRLADLHKVMNVFSQRPPSQATTMDDKGAWPQGALSEIRGGKKGDVLKLGVLLLCMAVGKLDIVYPPTTPDDLPDTLKDFITKCIDANEQRRFPAHELLNHPYVSPSPHSSHTLTTSAQRPYTFTPQEPHPLPSEMRFQRSDSIVGSPAHTSCLGRSRLETEFEELENLGSGGFGDVFKVRNHLDGRLYALKKIVMKRDNRMMTRITREVEMLSQMNHENVVRYYNAWIETYSEEQFKKYSGVDLSDSGSEEEESEESEEEGPESESDTSDDDQGHSEDSEVVFLENFSESSSEGQNVLGELESQVMKSTPYSRHRFSTTESSDTVVFAETSLLGGAISTQPISVFKPEKRRERRKEHSDGQVQILYIQMEYCDNETLRQLIDAGQLHSDHDLVWRLFRELVEGLEHIHSKGMIHRDLKPGNIFLNSSGHIKVGDFGLATSHKTSHYRQNSIQVNTSLDLADDTQGQTGLVGTAMYVSPEMLKPVAKYSQKVDIYSLGIIFFEMCHAPFETAMERHKVLVALRRREIVIPSSLSSDNMEKQIKVIRLLLNHNPHDRPTSKELLQNPLLPLKMEDEELQEVLQRTLQAPNSTRYRHLIDELFVQEGSRAQEFSYFMDPPDAKRGSQSLKRNKYSFLNTLLQDSVITRLASIFTRHGATLLSPPLLAPLRSGLYDETCKTAQFIDRNGRVVHLPPNLRVPFARYVVQQNITYLKRYTIMSVYRENKIQGFHPREHLECQFDIVSPSQASLVPDAEVMYVVSEIMCELPGFHGVSWCLMISHTSILAAVLSHCSIPQDKHQFVWPLIQKMSSGALKLSEFDKRLKDNHILLSPLALKALQKFISSTIPFDSDEVQILFEPLTRDKASKVRSRYSEAWQEITIVVELLRQFGGKDNVVVAPGLCPPHYSHFSGIIFQYVETGASVVGSKRNKRKQPLAVGGRYDELLKEFNYPGHQHIHPSVSVVGVTINCDVLISKALSVQQSGTPPSVIKCSAIVCWLGRESLQRECLQLVHDLWGQGIAADLLYESLELNSVEEIQKFCWKHFIPHIVLLSDKSLFFERKQVKVRTVENLNKMTEKVLTISELHDYLSQKQHIIERADSVELKDTSRSLSSADSQSNILPPVNVNVITSGKITGHTKRRYHDQAVSKLLPLLQNVTFKQPLEVLAVDLKPDPLILLAAEVNKLVGSGEQDFSSIIKVINERHSECGKKYLNKVCDSIKENLIDKRKVPMLFLYSHSAEVCQTILNN